MSEPTYAEIIAEKYAGKKVEIYIGDDMGSLLYSDHDVSQKSVIVGTVIGAKGNCLTIEASVNTAVDRFDVEVDIQAWSIKGVMEYQETGVRLMTIFGNQQVRQLKR